MIRFVVSLLGLSDQLKNFLMGFMKITLYKKLDTKNAQVFAVT